MPIPPQQFGQLWAGRYTSDDEEVFTMPQDVTTEEGRNAIFAFLSEAWTVNDGAGATNITLTKS